MPPLSLHHHGEFSYVGLTDIGYTVIAHTKGDDMATGDRDRIETLPDRLRELRAACGLSQAELASRAGLGIGDVSKYEAGRRTPGLRVASLLAGALGCTVDDLLSPSASATEKRGRGRPKK